MSNPLQEKIEKEVCVYLFVEVGLPYNFISVSFDLEATAVQVYLQNRNVSICSLYIPPDYPNKKLNIKLNNLVANIRKSFIITMDSNAHHTSWGSNFCDARGRAIDSWLENSGLVLLNTGEPTYLHPNGPLRKLSSRNRVTPVSIQDGVQHGITFSAISTIPAASSPISAASSPISAELSLIPVTLSRSLKRSAVAEATIPIVARLTKHHKTLLNIVKHETLVNIVIHRETSWTTLKTMWNITKHSNTRHSMRRYLRSMRRHRPSAWRHWRSLRVFGDIGTEFPAISANAELV